MFSGRFDHALDDKGRVSLPVRFREVLTRESLDRLYITKAPFESERCLAVYPPSEWERLVGRLRQKPSFDPDVQQFKLWFLGEAHEVQVDRQGRILVPPRLREYAGLDRDVTFAAMVDHFQLWDRARLDAALLIAEERVKKPQLLAKLDI